MALLSVADLGFGYGADKLFQGVTFTLDAGQKAALVAPNGAGKSTLLRLLGKELAPDEGTSVIRRGAKVAYFRQSHEVLAQGTVMDAFLSGFQEILELRHALTKAQHDAASGTDAALDAMAKAHDRYHAKGGDALERQIEMLAGHLGFTAAQMDRPVESLSGGERGRLHLGVVLAQNADLLLLDEPTNHLDLDTIAWLEGHLRDAQCAILCVSHDRAFLDAVCGETFELGRRSFRTYPLKYSDYVIAREEDLTRERELAERQADFVAKTEDFIRRNIAGQKTKQAQSRRKMLDKMDVLDRPEDVWALAERVSFRFAPAPRSGDIVLDAKGLAASRGGRALFEGVDLFVKRGERIGIIGPNGSGKSTLLKLLAEQGGPEDRGEIRRGTNLREGYFDQHLGSLDPAKTAVEEIRSVRGDMNQDGCRQYLSRFRFYGDDPLRRVQGFSGGERSRLALAKLLLEPRNLLFLDEPTNHLDIPAAEILEEALASFEGTVILVSHDRRFLSAVTTRTVAIHDGVVDVYPGGFDDYLHARAKAAAAPDPEEDEAPDPTPSARQRAVKRSASTRPGAPAAKVDAPQTPEEKRRAFEAEKAAARAADRKKKRVKELEGLIADGESKLAALREELKNHPGGDWAKVAELANKEQSLSKDVDRLMTEWMELSSEVAS
ncbi:MAG: ABC-F family ATP-binding cassette domain-containing protein [Polyangiaceae bacterium]